MKNNPRLDRVVALIDEAGFLTVADISRLCEVSEMTIRRYLDLLDEQKRIKRIYGGAVSLNKVIEDNVENAPPLDKRDEVLLVDQVDVLIGTSVNPYYDSLLIERSKKKNIPIIAESIEMPNQRTIVAVDNYQAGYDLGCWAGDYMREKGVKKVNLLDLTFHQPNTQERSHGFIDGLTKTNPTSETTLTINSQSRYSTAYQLARDALAVYPQINLIFAINDITAWGAINACRDLKINPMNMTVIVFGLEGETLKNELMTPNSYCKAGLAMFPEIVSLTCLEGAIAAFNQEVQPEKYITPYVILTASTLPDYYFWTETGWKLNWKTVKKNLKLPVQIDRETPHPVNRLPKQIGLIVPFSEHEWYKNLTALLKENAKQYGISLQVIDADQNVRAEMDQRRRMIAAKAASLIDPGDVVLVDGGPIALDLAEELKSIKDITIITNSVEVFNTLNHTPGIVLISTGGAIRYSTQMLVGPTAENALKELRADKLFLMVSGISLDFGLSHHTISEVTIKQEMIRSAREVYVLADHTVFGAEVGIQVAPLIAVHTLITSDALPPSTRLDISKLGIQIILA
ncbi:MAG: substrate-binding domain-containing protein [Anaerolineaceae bacterium]